MLHKTPGVILKNTKYKETSLITKIYTGEFGLQSYIINGVRSARSKNKAALLRPGTLLNLVVYHREGRSLNRLKEWQVLHVFREVPFEIKKGGLLLFIMEVLGKCLQESEKNETLFEFIRDSIIYLDRTQKPVKNFHLLFLLKLSAYIGFYPREDQKEENIYFDLREGVFTPQISDHRYVANATISGIIQSILSLGFDEISELNFNKTDKKQLLENLLNYYRLHIPLFGKVNTPDILEEVWR